MRIVSAERSHAAIDPASVDKNSPQDIFAIAKSFTCPPIAPSTMRCQLHGKAISQCEGGNIFRAIAIA